MPIASTVKSSPNPVAAAGEAGTHWANSTSQCLTYEQDRITRENALLAQYSGSGCTYGISAATVGRQQAVDVATAEKNLSIGQYQGSPTAQDDYDTAIAAAEADYGLGLAGANLTWTTDVVGAETTFLCEEATGRKELVTGVAGLSPGLAGLDKTYKVNLAGHASTADNDDAADLVQFWNDAESAKSDRYYDQCWAWADFRYDSYAKQASAVATLATTIDIPWAHFQADLYAAKRDWWNTTMSDYLIWVSDTNQEYEDYQAAVGTEYVDLVALTTAADVTYITEMAGAEETRQVAKATAGETYVHTIAGARETYLVAMSQASRDLADGGDQSTYDSTVSSAADTYRTDAAGASGDRRVDLAQADKDYTDAIYGETGHALTWESGRAVALKDFTIAEATAQADLRSNLATLRRDYLTLEAQSYAAALDTLAATSGTPWATLLAAEAAAEAARIAEILSEEALLEIAAATAARDSQIAEATATETLTTAESSAQAAWQVATADAACDQATAQADGEAELATGGGGSSPLPSPSQRGSVPAPWECESSQQWQSAFEDYWKEALARGLTPTQFELMKQQMKQQWRVASDYFERGQHWGYRWDNDPSPHDVTPREDNAALAAGDTNLDGAVGNSKWERRAYIKKFWQEPPPSFFGALLRGERQEPEPYGTAVFWFGFGDSVKIGTAPEIETAPRHYVEWGTVTVFPEYGGGTITPRQLSRAGALACRYAQRASETRAQYIKRVLDMARNDQGQTQEEIDRLAEVRARRAAREAAEEARRRPAELKVTLDPCNRANNMLGQNQWERSRQTYEDWRSLERYYGTPLPSRGSGWGGVGQLQRKTAIQTGEIPVVPVR